MLPNATFNHQNVPPQKRRAPHAERGAQLVYDQPKYHGKGSRARLAAFKLKAMRLKKKAALASANNAKAAKEKATTNQLRKEVTDLR
jgi:hypothetical protein